MMHYDEDRVWINIDRCPSCGSDHPEMEFKRSSNNTLLSRCFLAKAELKYDQETGIVTSTEETPKVVR